LFLLTFAPLFGNMLKKLQNKWKVNGLQLALILCTFAIGGSLTGYAARKLIVYFNIEQNWLWIIFYILLVTLLWPLAVLIVSIPLGQSRFFIKYLKKVGKRMGIVESEKSKKIKKQKLNRSDPFPISHRSSLIYRIAIFASGTGSNAQKIIDYFRNSSLINISLIVCNNPNAGVLLVAGKENIPALLIEKEKFFRDDAYINELKAYHIDFIVLAGFLWKMPESLIKTWSRKIINIHPALLPKYGGRGMYGNKVHEAVLTAGDKESGITIHYADEHYDNGDIILQIKCPVMPDDTPDTLAQRVHALEYQYYPATIEQLLKEKVSE
jgi:phosphoribosylglycinamide formyltransferase 1